MHVLSVGYNYIIIYCYTTIKIKYYVLVSNGVHTQYVLLMYITHNWMPFTKIITGRVCPFILFHASGLCK